MAKVFQDSRKRKGGLRPWIVSYIGLDGRRHRDLANVSTKEEALMVLRAKQTEIAKARISGVNSLEALKSVRLGEFVTGEYLPHCEATHRAATLRGERSVLKLLAGSRLWSMNLRSILSGDVQRWFDEETTKKGKGGRSLKPATINRRFAFLSGALSEAVKRGLIERNPAHGIAQLPERNGRVRWINADEEARLMGVLPEYLRPVVLTALNTGGRFSEVIGLTWGDLDFTAGLVRFADTKSGKTRHVPMNAVLRDALKSVSPVIGKDGAVPFVFTNPETMTHYTNVAGGFTAAVKRAGLTGVSFHVLRHSFGSRLAQAGISPEVIRTLMGHGSYAMTQRYMHLSPSNLRSAVDALIAPKPVGSGTSTAQAPKSAQVV
ncbi:MAG: site-specific integrase [Planctomycetia bacterium]|nr:site-specific integrase [Planctomycetia bacterium]